MIVNPGVDGCTVLTPNQRKIFKDAKRRHRTKNLLKGY